MNSRMRNRTEQKRQSEEDSFGQLPEPCETCAPNGGHWAHSIKHSEFHEKPVSYEYASRCSCSRGRALAGMDFERGEGRTPAGSHADLAAEEKRESAKWRRWKAEYHNEQRRRKEQVREFSVPINSNQMPDPKPQDERIAKSFARKVDA